MQEKYEIRNPKKSDFLAFLDNQGITDQEKEAINSIILTTVLVDEKDQAWTIKYATTQTVNEAVLAAVANKLTAACSYVKNVTFEKEMAETIVDPGLSYDEKAYLKALQVLQEEKAKPKEGVLYGKGIPNKKKITPIKEAVAEENRVIFIAKVVKVEAREQATGAVMLNISLMDDTDGIYAKIRFGSKQGKEDAEQNRIEANKLMKKIPPDSKIKIMGDVSFDKYSGNEYAMLRVHGIEVVPEENPRMDNEEVKRVELHCHTKMSKLDALTPIDELVETAVKWGHKALAITDHGVVQAFPFAYDKVNKLKSDLKLIFGVEGYLCSSRNSSKTYHIIILAKNTAGLRNLYRLISMSHLQYFGGKRPRPRVTKNLINQYREGLIIGSACAAGELFQAILDNKTEDELQEIISFYDYLEIQPIGNNAYLLREGKYPNITSDDDLRAINKRIYNLGKRAGKLTVATCDVHFLKPEDSIYRTILQAAQHYSDADTQPPLFYRTTEEMLEEFSYFGDEIAREIVIENTNKINDQVEKIMPVPRRDDNLYQPVIPGAEKKIHDLTYSKARELYGEVLPKIVEDRIKFELDSIIGNGFAVLYYIAHLLIKRSNEDGYMVGSRGSVGSSFVATLTNITEVNPLVPHYRCPNCKHTEFFEDGSIGSGFDLPKKDCPECGTPMIRDGHNIPFAVFLGFRGEKVPDIDLNFSGEYQGKAHKYTEDLFGRDNVFRAGTLGTIAEKTAEGYVYKYFQDKDISVRRPYLAGMARGLVDVKRTTGQHPGGIVVIPRDLDVNYITPVQRPADDRSVDIITTHYDWHSIDERLVKLDILGHDDPTMIKRLGTLLNMDMTSIPMDDEDTLKIFSSLEPLGITTKDLDTDLDVGTLGVPECGTSFVRQMLNDVKPKNFSDLLRVSGYSHGTNVWLNNAQDLIKGGTPTEDTISTRDDIMTGLINRGVEPSIAFKIMEYCRKGKAHAQGFTGDNKFMLDAMVKAKVPEWYINSCKTVEYLFPKAHAAAYVIMAFRIAYCKVHYPKEFYAAYFSIRTPEFDYTLVHKGAEFMKNYIRTVQNNNKATDKEKVNKVFMESAVEMLARGIKFDNVDIYKSDAINFLITDTGLLPPLKSIDSIGEKAALSIVEARKNGPFISKENLRKRTGLSANGIEKLSEIGALENWVESDQVALF